MLGVFDVAFNSALVFRHSRQTRTDEKAVVNGKLLMDGIWNPVGKRSLYDRQIQVVTDHLQENTAEVIEGVDMTPEKRLQYCQVLAG